MPHQDELYLYVRNDGDIYHRMLQPLYRRLATHKEADTYQRSRAMPEFLRVVDAAAKKYQREFGSEPFSSADRRYAAAKLASYFEVEWDLNKMGSAGPATKKSDAQIRAEIDQWQGEQGAAHASARQARKTTRASRPRAYGRRDV